MLTIGEGTPDAVPVQMNPALSTIYTRVFEFEVVPLGVPVKESMILPLFGSIALIDQLAPDPTTADAVPFMI